MQLGIKTIIKSLFLLYLFIYLVTLSSVSFAATNRFVNATLDTTCKATACSGDCYNTIQGAIDGAADGDTIYVCSNSTGRHNENVIINKSINLYGNQSSVLVNASSTSSPVFRVLSNNVNITNFTVRDANGNAAASVGVYLDANSTMIYNLTVTNSRTGIYLDNAYSNLIINNTVFNNSLFNFFITLNSSRNNITANIIYNSTDGFQINNASHNIFRNNNIYNNSGVGIWIYESGPGSVHNHTFINNTLYNNPGGGIIVSSSGNDNATDNVVYNNSDVGISFSDSRNGILIGNIVSNSSIGFSLSNVTGFNLSLNNATNNSGSQYLFTSAANITFTGVNRAFQTPSGALDLNISGGSNVTTLVGTTYNNFTTTYGTIFFDRAINVSIKVMNLTDSSAATTGCNSFSGTCTLITTLVPTNSLQVINITNNSGTARINLGMFYNTSLGASSPDIARYSSGWLQLGQTAIDTTAGSIRYNDITTFSTFGVVNFVAAATASSSSTSSVQPLSIDFSTAAKLTCPGNLLELVATSKGSAVSDVLVRLILYNPYEGFKQEKLTNADGKVIFDLTNEKEGRYQLDSSKTGYAKPDDIFFDFVHCAAGVQPQPVVEEPKSEVEEEKPAEPESPPAIIQPTNVSQPEPVKEKPKEQEPIGKRSEEPKPEPPREEKLPEEQKSGGLDLGQIVLLLVAVGIVGFVIYKIFAKPRGYSGFKK